MILPIYVYGQPVLRKEAEDITPDYPNLKELIANMFETMNRADGRDYPEESFSFSVSGLGRVPAVDYYQLLYSRCGYPCYPKRL